MSVEASTFTKTEETFDIVRLYGYEVLSSESITERVWEIEQVPKTISYPGFDRILDVRSGLYIRVLNISKDIRSLKKTEGILADFAKKLRRKGISPSDLIKRVWKSSR